MSRSAGVQINLYGRRHDRDVLKRVAAQRGTSASALVMNWVRSLESSIQPNAEPPALGEISFASLHDRDHNQEDND
jgi:hypothetical protein